MAYAFQIEIKKIDKETGESKIIHKMDECTYSNLYFLAEVNGEDKVAETLVGISIADIQNLIGNSRKGKVAALEYAKDVLDKRVRDAIVNDLAKDVFEGVFGGED